MGPQTALKGSLRAAIREGLVSDAYQIPRRTEFVSAADESRHYRPDTPRIAPRAASAGDGWGPAIVGGGQHTRGFAGLAKGSNKDEYLGDVRPGRLTEYGPAVEKVESAEHESPTVAGRLTSCWNPSLSGWALPDMSSAFQGAFSGKLGSGDISEERLHRAFAEIDINHVGQLDKQGLAAALRGLGRTDQQIHAVLSGVQKEALGFEEFQLLVAPPSKLCQLPTNLQHIVEYPHKAQLCCPFLAPDSPRRFCVVQ